MVRLGCDRATFSGVMGRWVGWDVGTGTEKEGSRQGRELGKRDILSNCLTSDTTVLPEVGFGRMGLYEARIFSCPLAGIRKEAACEESMGVRGTLRDRDLQVAGLSFFSSGSWKRMGRDLDLEW